MRKVLVLQHVAHEPLGTLNPILKDHKLKIKYVNFQRHPDLKPDVSDYNGLVVLGGPMGVYDSKHFPHIQHELNIIEQALKMDIPVLGICLGAQMIAKVLGARVSPHHEKEIGWHKVSFTADALNDRLFQDFNKEEVIFQYHGDSFDIPQSTTHLATSKICEAQGFKYGKKVYAFQFHIEVDEAMIKRWMKVPTVAAEMQNLKYVSSPEEIMAQTLAHIDRSLVLSRKCFNAFVDLFELPERPEIVGSGHGKPSRKVGV